MQNTLTSDVIVSILTAPGSTREGCQLLVFLLQIICKVFPFFECQSFLLLMASSYTSKSEIELLLLIYMGNDLKT